MKLIDISFSKNAIEKILEIEFDKEILSTNMEGVEFEVWISDKGEDGKTPIKGVDYFTQGEKEEIVEKVYRETEINSISFSEIENLF